MAKNFAKLKYVMAQMDILSIAPTDIKSTVDHNETSMTS